MVATLALGDMMLLRLSLAVVLVAPALSAVWVNPCESQPAASMAMCDVTKPLAVRVANLVANLTVDEKIGLFTNGAFPVERLNIGSYQWWSEGLHGVAWSPGVTYDAQFPFATSFPQVDPAVAAVESSVTAATVSLSQLLLHAGHSHGGVLQCVAVCRHWACHRDGGAGHEQVRRRPRRHIRRHRLVVDAVVVALTPQHDVVVVAPICVCSPAPGLLDSRSGE
jgi:hypothetical protein